MSWLWIVNETVQPQWAAEMETRLNKKLGAIMALVQVEQDELNALDAALDEVTTTISDRIQALIDAGSLPAADVSALQADVENLRSLGAPQPPAEEPPA